MNMQLVDMIGEDPFGGRFGFIDKPADFFIDQLRRGLRHVGLLGDRMAEKDFLLITGISYTS